MKCTPPPLSWRQFFNKVPLRQNVIIKVLTTCMTPGLLEKIQQFDPCLQWKGSIYNASKLLWKRTWKGTGLQIEQYRKLQRIIVCNYLNLSSFWLAFHCLHIFLLFSIFFTLLTSTLPKPFSSTHVFDRRLSTFFKTIISLSPVDVSCERSAIMTYILDCTK